MDRLISSKSSKKTRIKFIFLISSGISLIFFSFLFLCLCLYPPRNRIAKEKFYHYSEICLPKDCNILSEEQDIGFTDEYYSAKVQCSPKSIEWLLSIKPRWTKMDWKKGEKSFFRNHIKEIGEKYYMIYGAEGSSVCRTIVIDKSQNTVEFEYITF